MKKTLLILLPIVIATSFSFKPSVDPLPIGSSIPNAHKKMKNVAGMELSFKDAMNAKGLLVMFSCNTCPVVHAYQSRTTEVCNYAKSKNIGVILLNSNEGSRDNGDSFSDMKEYANEQSYNWAYVVDENSVMANAFGATRTPECFLFNGEGKLVYHGAIDDNQNGPDEVTRKHLKIAMDETLEGKDVAIKKTRSVGCTIKRIR